MTAPEETTELSPKELAAQRRIARTLPTEFLECRMMRHRLNHRFHPTRAQLKITWGTPVGWTCDSCGTVRIDVIDSRGKLSWRKYDYPDSYTLDPGQRVSIEVIRVEWLRRIKAADRG